MPSASTRHTTAYWCVTAYCITPVPTASHQCLLHHTTAYCITPVPTASHHCLLHHTTAYYIQYTHNCRFSAVSQHTIMTQLSLTKQHTHNHLWLWECTRALGYHLCRIGTKVKIVFAYWRADRNSLWNFGQVRIDRDGSNGH